MTSRRWRGRGGAPADESRTQLRRVGSWRQLTRKTFLHKATNFWAEEVVWVVSP